MLIILNLQVTSLGDCPIRGMTNRSAQVPTRRDLLEIYA